MLSVDRGKYSKQNPYVDGPQSIGYGVTISAPHMVNKKVFFFWGGGRRGAGRPLNSHLSSNVLSIKFD